MRSRLLRNWWLTLAIPSTVLAFALYFVQDVAAATVPGSDLIRLCSAHGSKTAQSASSELATCAISGLNVSDALYIVSSISVTARTAGSITAQIKNKTDNLGLFSSAATTMSPTVLSPFGTLLLVDEANSKVVGCNGWQSGNFFITCAQTFTTAYTGSWTMAFNAILASSPSGYAYSWSWDVYKLTDTADSESGGATLPDNSTGYLFNDGEGNLNWDDMSDAIIIGGVIMLIFGFFLVGGVLTKRK